MQLDQNGNSAFKKLEKQVDEKAGCRLNKSLLTHPFPDTKYEHFDICQNLEIKTDDRLLLIILSKSCFVSIL